MRISIIHDWEPSIEQEYTWRDGLCAAIKVLSEKHEVKFWTVGDNFTLPHPYFPIHFSRKILEEVSEFDPDVILHWADCTRPHAAPLYELGKPMALCFAGGDTMRDNAMYFSHFFVESSVYKAKFEAMGKSVSMAFGTNTDLFKPMPQQSIMFDVIFPATYCEWKRHKLFSQATRGLKTCTAGFMYEDHEQYCWQICDEGDNLTLPHVSAEALARLYNASKCVVVTSRADGGSQRTVLEAMACNVPVIVMSDSDKTTEYVREGGGKIVDPDPKAIRDAIVEMLPHETRSYILSKWSHIKYAEALEKGLVALL